MSQENITSYTELYNFTATVDGYELRSRHDEPPGPAAIILVDGREAVEQLRADTSSDFTIEWTEGADEAVVAKTPR